MFIEAAGVPGGVGVHLDLCALDETREILPVHRRAVKDSAVEAAFGLEAQAKNEITVNFIRDQVGILSVNRFAPRWRRPRASIPLPHEPSNRSGLSR